MGKSFLDIAGEKGGIIKKGVDVVTAVTQPPVGTTLEAIVAERGAPLWRVGKDMRYRPTLAGLDHRSLKLRMWGLRLGLGGRSPEPELVPCGAGDCVTAVREGNPRL